MELMVQHINIGDEEDRFALQLITIPHLWQFYPEVR